MMDSHHEAYHSSMEMFYTWQTHLTMNGGRQDVYLAMERKKVWESFHQNDDGSGKWEHATEVWNFKDMGKIMWIKWDFIVQILHKWVCTYAFFYFFFVWSNLHSIARRKISHFQGNSRSWRVKMTKMRMDPIKSVSTKEYISTPNSIITLWGFGMWFLQ